MYENNQPLVIVAILLSCSSFMLGAIIGIGTSESYTRKQTVIDCITRPKECKIEYDYYLLKNKE
jgi:hypothetical protein